MTLRAAIKLTATARDPGGSAAGVSVILVVRNGAAFVTAAIESVLAGTRLPQEILVVDGQSTDATVELASAFGLVRIVRQADRGIANAYNLGLQHARSDIVAFISHDDLWAPAKLERQLELMERRPELEFTVTLVEHFLEPGVQAPPGFRRELLDSPVPGMIMEALVARRSAFERIGRFDPGFEVSEDTDWFARARDAGLPMAVIPEVLVRKRVHASNVSLVTPALNQLLLRAVRNSLRRKASALNRAHDA